MAFSSFFQKSSVRVTTHESIMMEHDLTIATVDDIAKKLAYEIVVYRCRKLEASFFDAWKNRVESNTNLSTKEEKLLRGLLIPTFGTPGQRFTGSRVDHLEGFVGEWLWYFLIIENVSNQIEHVEMPGFKSIDPGGDAFIIHRLSTGDLMYRLWEMKKFAPNKPGQKVNSTVTKAYKQLSTKGLEYLARYTATGQEMNNPELESFFGKIMEYWIDSNDAASAGVSICTSNTHMDPNCFCELGNQFPQITNGLLMGILTGLSDFSKFSEKVQDYIWKGL